MDSFAIISDVHLVNQESTLYGGNPLKRVGLVLDNIEMHIGAIDFILVTGDISHRGESETYDPFFELMDKRGVTCFPLIGNHDQRENLLSHVDPNLIDSGGYLQYKIEGKFLEIICIDTVENPKHTGHLNSKKLEFLEKQILNSNPKKHLILAMHHQPMDIGISSADQFQLQDAEKLINVFEENRKPDYLLFGHVHRTLQGIWNGIPYRSQKGLNHQVSRHVLDGNKVGQSFEDPEYTLCTASEKQLHFDCVNFLYQGPHFSNKDDTGKNFMLERSWIPNV